MASQKHAELPSNFKKCPLALAISCLVTAPCRAILANHLIPCVSLPNESWHLQLPCFRVSSTPQRPREQARTDLAHRHLLAKQCFFNQKPCRRRGLCRDISIKEIWEAPQPRELVLAQDQLKAWTPKTSSTQIACRCSSIPCKTPSRLASLSLRFW